MKHIVKLTLSNPSHEHVSMRMRMKQQDYITEGRDESEAINRAARHFQSLGFKVHSAVIVEQKVETPEPVNAEPVSLSEAVDYKALEKPTVARVKSGETKLPPRTNYDIPPAMRKKAVDKKAALEAFIARRKETVTEETAPQYIEEKLSAADPASKWIHDFVHSDNPKFAGKSKEERIKMALGAKYAAQRNEEVAPEEVDEETKQRKASVAKDKVGRLAWRAGTADEIKKNHLKVYKKLKSTDPEKAEKFKQAYKVEEEVEQIDEAEKQHGLYKYNKRSGYWDHQRSVTPENKDQWLHHFKKDEPEEHFIVSKNKPKHNPMKEEVEQIEEADVKSKPVMHKGKEIGETGIDTEASSGNGKWYAKHHKSKMNTVGFDSRKEAEAEVRAAHGIDEEVEQVDEASKNLRFDPEAALQTTAPVVKNWQKAQSGDPRAKAAWSKHVRRIQKVDPTSMSKKDIEDHMKSNFGEEVEQANEAADPGETKVVNKAVKTKKASAAADRMVKIAKSKVNKINMDPKLDNDVKQSSRY
jgi:hypothetical protein